MLRDVTPSIVLVLRKVIRSAAELLDAVSGVSSKTGHFTAQPQVACWYYYAASYALAKSIRSPTMHRQRVQRVLRKRYPGLAPCQALCINIAGKRGISAAPWKGWEEKRVHLV